MAKLKFPLKFILEILGVILTVAVLLLFFELRPVNNYDPPGSSLSFPPPTVPTVPEVVSSYPSPADQNKPVTIPSLAETYNPYPAPEPTSSARKPPACTFPNPESSSNQNPENLNNYQFSAPRSVFSSAPGISIATWLPDSERLLIKEDSHVGQQSIETLNIRSGELVQYAIMNGGGGKLVWINDLQAVAYPEYINNHYELWMSDQKAKNINIISNDASNWSVSGSDNGNQIVFLSWSSADIPQIWNAASKEITSVNLNLTNWEYEKYKTAMPLGLPGRDFSIALQPHGSKMALFGRAWFFVFDEASGDICEIDLGIGREGFNSVLQAEWSPDGQYIALIITGYAPRQILQYSVVMVIDFKTGKQETIPLDSPFVYEISWSNNNQFLAIMGADINVHGNISSRSRIYVADILKDKNPTLISDQLFGGGATDGWLLKWSPDGSEIATKCPTWSTSEPLITEDKICLIDVTKNP